MNLIRDINEWENDDAARRNPESQIPAAKENTMQVTMEQSARKLFTPTNNVSRETFNAVRDNPGRTRVEITLLLASRGFNKSSVASLLGQMVRQKMLREIAGSLYATGNEYTPVKAHSTIKNKAKPKVAPKAAPKAKEEKPEVGIAALPAAATAPIIKTEWDAKTMIDHLSVRQARALYEELKKLFEGQ